MRLDKLTNKFQQALSDAQSLALGKDNQYIEPIHVLSAMLNQEGSSIKPLLASAGANVATLQQDLTQAIERLPQVQGVGGEIIPSQEFIRVLNLCDKLAQKSGDSYISSELFILAALEEKGSLGDILKKAGITKDKFSQVVSQVRGNDSVNDPNAEDQRGALKKYTIDLTEREIGRAHV